jgi:ATP-dependent Clp protease protease subunit
MSWTVLMVVERTSNGERGYEIFSRFLKNRIVFLGALLDDVVCNLIVARPAARKRHGDPSSRA